MSVAGALVFPQAVDVVGSSAPNMTAECLWQPDWPYTDSITGKTAAELARDYEPRPESSGPSAIAQYAKFEWAVDVFKRVADILDKKDTLARVRTTRLETCLGLIDFTAPLGLRDPSGSKHPMENVYKSPVCGVQWVNGTTFAFEPRLVANASDPELQAVSPIEPHGVLMQVTVRTVALVKTLLGRGELEVSLPEGADLDALFARLGEIGGERLAPYVAVPRNQNDHLPLRVIVNGRDIVTLDGRRTVLHDGRRCVHLHAAGGRVVGAVGWAAIGSSEGGSSWSQIDLPDAHACAAHTLSGHSAVGVAVLCVALLLVFAVPAAPAFAAAGVSDPPTPLSAAGHSSRIAVKLAPGTSLADQPRRDLGAWCATGAQAPPRPRAPPCRCG